MVRAIRISILRIKTNEGTVSLGVSVVIPCLNEAKSIGLCIAEAKNWARTSGVECEILVADNGSIDGSQELASSLGARIVPVSIRGYGSALDSGIRAATHEYVVMADADYSYDFSHSGRFLEALENGADLVIGNRFRGIIHSGAMPFKNRYLGNPVLSMLARLLFKIPIGDFHCGMRGVRKSAYLEVRPKSLGMEFATEMILRFSSLGKVVTEVETNLRKDKRGRPPHLRPWRDGFRHLSLILLLKPKSLVLQPSVTMFFIFLSIFAWLALSSGAATLLGVRLGSGAMFLASAAASIFAVTAALGLFLDNFSRNVTFSTQKKSDKGQKSLSKKMVIVGSGLVSAGVTVFVAYLITWAQNEFIYLEYETSALLASLVSFSVLTGIGFLAVGIAAELISYSTGFEEPGDT